MKKYLLKYLLLILIHIINLPQILVMYMFSLISFIGEIIGEIADGIANFINYNCLIGKKLVLKYLRISREILREKGKWC